LVWKLASLLDKGLQIDVETRGGALAKPLVGHAPGIGLTDWLDICRD
jgi:hypothetical protein